MALHDQMSGDVQSEIENEQLFLYSRSAAAGKCLKADNAGKKVLFVTSPGWDKEESRKEQVLKQVEAEETTKSGIILTASAQEKPSIAEVVEVGPGGIVDGNEVKMTVKVGDKVITSKYSGTEIKLDGVDYIIVRQGDILAIVE